ncbi:MAG: hypothetical protein J3Q66DRAFT_439316 [Benniella sp.]|nr:MAG: hypothetical protein J3Q66DRAFT_439316 [Benniella sp.]
MSACAFARITTFSKSLWVTTLELPDVPVKSRSASGQLGHASRIPAHTRFTGNSSDDGSGEGSNGDTGSEDGNLMDPLGYSHRQNQELPVSEGHRRYPAQVNRFGGREDDLLLDSSQGTTIIRNLLSSALGDSGGEWYLQQPYKAVLLAPILQGIFFMKATSRGYHVVSADNLTSTMCPPCTAKGQCGGPACVSSRSAEDGWTGTL